MEYLAAGGATSNGGTLENKRSEMSQTRYETAGGKEPPTVANDNGK